jgi:uncharacterized Fe-S radical SAM superfamily protein PflX
MVKGSYLKLPPGGLAGRAQKAVAMLEDCTVCAQECRVNRLKGELGQCRGGRLAAVSSHGPHFGEEDVLVGTGGSGTIFLTFCNLSCEFCQNCEISQHGAGVEVSAAAGYFSVAKKAVKKMHGQVGDLILDGRGLACRGLLVRHLVLPGNLARSEKVFEFLADEISQETYINIMDQYYPAFKAFNYPELSRRITRREYREAVAAAVRAGLQRIV